MNFGVIFDVLTFFPSPLLVVFLLYKNFFPYVIRESYKVNKILIYRCGRLINLFYYIMGSSGIPKPSGNPWIQHVKKVQKEKGISYKEALKLAKHSYKK
jgi:hypothetical protein